MFGFERGAFTDARQAKKGLFQTAHRGTLFLDEIGLLPDGLQAKLLTVLEERTVRRLGATQSEPVDVWVIAATNLDLQAATRAGRFREDLYHRLAVLTLALPPLRERQRDIVLLAEHFLARACADYGLPAKTLSPEARDDAHGLSLARQRARADEHHGARGAARGGRGRDARPPGARSDAGGGRGRARPGEPGGRVDAGRGRGRRRARPPPGGARGHRLERHARGGASGHLAQHDPLSDGEARPAFRRAGAAPAAPTVASRGAAGRGSRGGRPSGRCSRAHGHPLGASEPRGAPGDARVRPRRRASGHRTSDRGAGREGPVVRRARRGAGGERVRRALRARPDRGPGATGGARGAGHAARGGSRGRTAARLPAPDRHRSGVLSPRATRGRVPGRRRGQANGAGRDERAARRRGGRHRRRERQGCVAPGSGLRSLSPGRDARSPGRVPPRRARARGGGGGAADALRRPGPRARSPAEPPGVGRARPGAGGGHCRRGGHRQVPARRRAPSEPLRRALPRGALPALRDPDPVPAARRAAAVGLRDRRDRRAGGHPREASSDARPGRHGRGRGDAVPAASSWFPARAATRWAASAPRWSRRAPSRPSASSAAASLA